jgi:hypothetical protein
MIQSLESSGIEKSKAKESEMSDEDSYDDT